MVENLHFAGTSRDFGFLEKEKLEFLSRLVNHGMIECDIQGRIFTVNPAACNILDCSEEKLISKNISDFLPILNDLSSLIDLSQFSFETELLTGNKENNLLVNILGKPYNYNGEVIFQLVIITKNDDDDFVKKERERLYYRLSHEFKTPLNSICSGINLLKELIKDFEGIEINEILDIIITGSERLKKIINTIEFTEYEIPADNEIEQYQLEKLVDEIIQKHDILIQSRFVDIRTSVDPMIAMFKSKIFLKRALSEILLNAINNSEKFGKIYVRIEDNININEKFYIQITIQDFGVGFSPNELADLFSKFKKIERFGEGYGILTDGCGIGLYLANKIIKKLGGKLIISSPGREMGTKVKILLPAN